jgi:hypothetical protein
VEKTDPELHYSFFYLPCDAFDPTGPRLVLGIALPLLLLVRCLLFASS